LFTFLSVEDDVVREIGIGDEICPRQHLVDDLGRLPAKTFPVLNCNENLSSSFMTISNDFFGIFRFLRFYELTEDGLLPCRIQLSSPLFLHPIPGDRNRHPAPSKGFLPQSTSPAR
jgi:hypothetical protein